MSNPNTYSSDFKNLFFLIVNTFIVLIILSFGYLLLEKYIVQFVNAPNYTDKELKELTEKRELQRLKEENENFDLIRKGIHVKTGLKADKNLQVVISSCTSCHSAKLITQNRATRKGWENMIDWMQETQGLADLGDNEPLILDYLSKYYAPIQKGRRANLDVAAIEWYILNLDDNQ